jgi:hypothetical protein
MNVVAMKHARTRNNVSEFARRTLKNLQYIESALENKADVHVITQLANSMLGLVILPWERQIEAAIKNEKLADLAGQGWPGFLLSDNKVETLGQFVRRLRNAMAHGEITFRSDSRRIEDVAIHLENHRKKNGVKKVVTWSADITAEEIRTFCIKFVGLLEQVDE